LIDNTFILNRSFISIIFIIFIQYKEKNLFKERKKEKKSINARLQYRYTCLHMVNEKRIIQKIYRKGKRKRERDDLIVIV